MDAQHWREIAELLHAASHAPPAEREQLLARADPEVRGQVESLLARESSDDASTVTQLAPGSVLGRYRIESQLGRGGMGEVFSALDTRLGRKVAIKTSMERFSERFEREARAISALNHPYICTLYDVGPNYLVMELVEGETLAARLNGGKLRIDDTLRFGAQIAEALAAAHLKGIVHRDLKPSNIMLTKTGVKVSTSESRNRRSMRLSPKAGWPWGRLPTWLRNNARAAPVMREPIFSRWEWFCTKWPPESVPRRIPFPI